MNTILCTSHFLLVTLLTSALAEAKIEDYVGCYETKIYNGRPMGPAVTHSEIKIIPAMSFYQTVERQDLPGLELRVAIPESPQPAHYVVQVAIKGAEVQETENSLQILFDGPIYNLFTGSIQNLKQQNKMEKTNGVLSSEIIGHSGNRESATMRPVTCP